MSAANVTVSIRFEDKFTPAVIESVRILWGDAAADRLVAASVQAPR